MTGRGIHMETFQTRTASFEIDHRGGGINLSIDDGENAVSLKLSVVETS